MFRSPLSISVFLLSGPLALAQTSTHHTPAHRSTAAHPASTSAAAAPACASLPPISEKVPALPASSGCPKPLFTVSDRLDYLSPLAQRFRTTLFADLPVVISLNYAEIAPGTGELAKPQQFYTVKYTGYLTDGSKFDSSEDHEETKNGFTFPYGAHRVIAGWDLGFEGMRVGGKRRLYVPYQFAYGAAGQPPKIPAKSMLIFDMELLSQSDTPPAAPTPPPASTPSGTAPSAAPGSAPSSAPGSAPDSTTPPSSAPSTATPSTTTPPASATPPANKPAQPTSPDTTAPSATTNPH